MEKIFHSVLALAVDRQRNKKKGAVSLDNGCKKHHGPTGRFVLDIQDNISERGAKRKWKRKRKKTDEASVEGRDQAGENIQPRGKKSQAVRKEGRKIPQLQ